jgi:hypothetical protein
MLGVVSAVSLSSSSSSFCRPPPFRSAAAVPDRLFDVLAYVWFEAIRPGNSPRHDASGAAAVAAVRRPHMRRVPRNLPSNRAISFTLWVEIVDGDPIFEHTDMVVLDDDGVRNLGLVDSGRCAAAAFSPVTRGVSTTAQSMASRPRTGCV